MTFILPPSLALSAASGILLEFHALSASGSGVRVDDCRGVCGLSPRPEGTRRAEGTWLKSMNFCLPLMPRSTSAPALSWPEHGSKRATSSLEGATGACSAGRRACGLCRKKASLPPTPPLLSRHRKVCRPPFRDTRPYLWSMLPGSAIIDRADLAAAWCLWNV